MKSILISIKPKYVAKILNGEKTIEIRKTMPKCDLPIDVYIYCTKDKQGIWLSNGKYDLLNENKYVKSEKNGKVVAKFTLNKVEEIKFNYKNIQEKSCLSEDELFDYLFDNTPYQEDMKKGYAWHISNLVIFDKPKELSEFYPYCKDKKCEYRKNHCSICYRTPLTKAPQSWQFVESEK